jgi:hypothetical protein
MVILLDIDGVLETSPSWRKPEIGPDGFMLFNKHSAENLADILLKTSASVILTSTHRIIFSITEWLNIFQLRGLKIKSLFKLNDTVSISEMKDRGSEIKEWVDNFGHGVNYVIIDDDSSINALPQYIKDRWVKIDPARGVDEEAKQKILGLLLKSV